MVNDNKKVGIVVLLLLSGLAIAGAFSILFAELADEVMSQEFGLFDNFIIRLVIVNQSETMDVIMFLITETGSVWFLASMTVIGVAWLWFKSKDRWSALFFAITVAGGGLLNSALKNLYGRERPSINEAIDATGYSFPSGHSMGAITLYGFLIFLVIRGHQNEWVKWTISISLAVLVLLIGGSRVYLGAHYPSDVVAGFIGGLVWLLLCIIALEWINWQTGNGIKPVKGIRNLLRSGLRLTRKSA